MKEVSTCEEIQERCLVSLLYFDKVCRENGLRYSLAFGTLIGAIRHHGFIPWDDDIDVLMPRPDFDKLTEVLKAQPSDDFGFMDYYDLENFFVTRILKIYNKKTYLKEYSEKYNLDYGAYIDVFPVDGIAEDLVKAKKDQKMYRLMYRLIWLYVSSKHRKKGIRKSFKNLFRPIAKWAQGKIEELIDAYSYEESKYVMILGVKNITKRRILKNSFDNLLDVDFEGHSVKVFSDYDDILRRQFGDYMEMPPEDQRVSHHKLEVYDLEDKEQG